MLVAHHITKYYKQHLVLDDVNVVVNARDRIGLLGENGAGKSTLLRILCGLETCDSGDMSLVPGVRVGLLHQEVPDVLGVTIDDFIQQSVGHLKTIQERLRTLETHMEQSSGDHLTHVLNEYGDLAEMFEVRGGYDIDHRIDAILQGLALDYLARERPIATLSGGEKARVALAALLLQAPDLLCLDEPTNHLDARSLAWLESFLSSYTGTIIVISHDRVFLNKVVTQIWDIDTHQHRVTCYAGNYDAWSIQKAQEQERWKQAYADQQEEIKELKRSIASKARQVGHNRGPRDPDKCLHHAKGERVQQAISKNVRNAQERLDRILADPIAVPPQPLRITPNFHNSSIESQAVVTAHQISKQYGTTTVLNDVTLTISARDRIRLAGANGSGKTTLLGILAGEHMPDAGSVSYAPQARVGFLPQEPVMADPGIKAWEYFRHNLIGSEEQLMALAMRYGLLRYDDMQKDICTLSVGQRRKLELLRLIALEPTILMVDEPTNHLSFSVLEPFEQAIMEFAGPVIVVSHDRWFSERFGGVVWELVDGRLCGEALKR